MAQINLLKQTSSDTNFLDAGPKILARALAIILALLVVYYIWLFIDLNRTENKTLETRAKINADKQLALDMPNRDEFLTRQLQLKGLEGLIGGHPYWSQLLPELSRVTLKNASYKSLTAGSGGEVALSVSVPTLADMSKYMEIFDLPEFNQNFSNIRIGSFSKVQDKTSTSIQFQVKMEYSPELIQYHKQTQ